MSDESIHECLLHEFNEEEVARMASVFVILGIIVLLGCVGNAVSLLIYSRNFQDSNSRSFLILLSGVELFSSSVSVPMEIYNLYVHFNFTDDKLCKSFVFTEICQVSVSCSVLLLIATDRWRKVCQPFGWQISVRLSKVFCVAIIPLGCLVASPSLAIYGSHYFDMNFSDADFPQCFGTNHPDQISNTSRIITSRVLRTYKCSITNEASEGILPILYSGFFWFLFFAEILLLSLMYGKIIRTIKIQDDKLAQNSRMGEYEKRKVYPKPGYRRRESIDLDCETDMAPSKYGFASTFVSDVSHDGGSENKPESTNLRSKLSSPSPKKQLKSDSECIPDDIVEAAIPRIKVIRIEAMPDQLKVRTNTDKSPSKSQDGRLLSPIIKRTFNSTVSSPKRVTIENRNKDKYRDQHDPKEVSDYNIFTVKNWNHDLDDVNKDTILAMQDRNLVCSSQETTNTLPPIEENETLRVTNITNTSVNTSDVKGQEFDISIDSGTKPANNDNEQTLKNYSHGKLLENCARHRDDSKNSGNDRLLDTKCVPSKDDSKSSFEEKDIKLSPDPSPEHVHVSHRRSRKLQRQSTRRQGRSRNVTVIMLAVTISTVVCFLPYLVLSLLRSLITDFEANLSAPNRVAYNLFVRSIYFKSLLNPVIYGLFDSRFRQVLKKLFKRKCCRT